MAIEKTSLMRYNDRIGLVFFWKENAKEEHMNKKAIVIVLDSVGIGELPDAANYGDKGADTNTYPARRRLRGRTKAGWTRTATCCISRWRCIAERRSRPSSG